MNKYEEEGDGDQKGEGDEEEEEDKDKIPRHQQGQWQAQASLIPRADSHPECKHLDHWLYFSFCFFSREDKSPHNTVSSLEKKEIKGQWADSSGKGAGCQAMQPEFHPPNHTW